MRSWLSSGSATALGAALGLAAYDVAAVAARSRLGGGALALLGLRSLGIAASLVLPIAIGLALLCSFRFAPDGPGRVASKVWQAGSGRVVGVTVGGLVWALLVGAVAYRLAEVVQTDSLRLTAVALAGLALGPLSWLAGAAAGAGAARRLTRAQAWLLPALLLLALVLSVAAARAEVALLGPDATVSPLLALAIALVGAIVGARGGKRLAIGLAAASALAIGALALPVGAEVRSALAFEAPNASVLGPLLPEKGSANTAVAPAPPPPPFALTRGTALRRRWPVVLITVDSLRPDHMGCYGYRRPTTPRLDAFARTALRFERAYAQGSSTRFSVPSFMTSRYMSQLAMRGRAILPTNTTLAEVLAAQGYSTVGLMAPTERGTGPGIGQGFERFQHSIDLRGEHIDEWITDQAVAALAAGPSRPLFLWVHLYDPHSPFVALPGAPRWGASEMDRYDAEVWSTDRQVGRLLEAVNERYGPDGAVVILSADHGEAFGEHGKVGHSGQLYEELVRVPLLVRVPGGVRGKTSMLAALVDVMPTVLDLTGSLYPAVLEGRSLLPWLEGRAPDPDRVVFEELRFGRASERGMRAAHQGRLHVLCDAGSSSIEGFDVVSDPGEQRPLSATGAHARRLEALRRAVLGLQARIEGPPR